MLKFKIIIQILIHNQKVVDQYSWKHHIKFDQHSNKLTRSSWNFNNKNSKHLWVGLKSNEIVRFECTQILSVFKYLKMKLWLYRVASRSQTFSKFVVLSKFHRLEIHRLLLHLEEFDDRARISYNIVACCLSWRG